MTKHNMLFSMLYLASSMLSSFILIPLFFQTLGAEAAGYVSLGQTFISMAQVFSIAITSLATRYIVISFHEGDYVKANEYFNSILAACIFLSGVLLTLLLFVIAFLPVIVNISDAFIDQMRLMLLFMAGSFTVHFIACPFLAGLYYQQDLRVMYCFQAGAQIARIVAPFSLFAFLGASIWLPYCAGFIVDFTALIIYIRISKSKLPELDISLKQANITVIKTIVSDGVWASLNKAGAIMLSSVSIYLSNVLVGRIETGYYSSFTQLQHVFSSYTTAVVGALVPVLIALYARKDKAEFYNKVPRYLKYLAISLGVLCGVTLIYQVSFFELWLDTSIEDYKVASYIIIGYLTLTYPCEVINQVLIIQVRIKIPAIAMMAFGLLALALTVLFCHPDGLSLGLIGVALAQAIAQILRSWCFLPYYVSRVYPSSLFTMLKGMIFGPAILCVVSMVSYLLSCVLPSPTSWIALFGDCVCCLFAGIAVAFFALSKQERGELIRIVLRKEQ